MEVCPPVQDGPADWHNVQTMHVRLTENAEQRRWFGGNVSGIPLLVSP